MLDFFVFFAHPTCNDELANRLANKTVKIKPNIKEFTESGIIFEDGTEVPKVDSVIFATGYKFSFPLIEHGNLIPVDDNQVSLYLNMFVPELSDHNSLAIIGLVQAWGSVMPISEIQSRLFYDALIGNTKLPKKAEMLKFIDESRDEMQKRYVKSPRHTIQVDFGIYMDKIGAILGCKPNLLKLVFTDPALAWTLWNSPPVSCTYRLTGPKPWAGARDTIMGMKERIYRGMAPDGKIIPRKTVKNFNYFKFFTSALILAIGIGIYTKKIRYQHFVNRFK
uniref:Flavin-containing monooxygenase n=1 Tax=Panagrolaimus davidi TaxID=227884 RepID=A0A914QKX3_9BILA